MKNFIYIFLISFVLLACEMPEKAPVFRNVTNVKTTRLKGTDLNFTANAIFFNPNTTGMKLKSVEIDVILSGKKVGHVSQKSKIKIQPNSNFTVPLSVDLDIKELSNISGIFGMLTGKQMQAEFTGYIRISKNGLVMRVPVKHQEMVKLNL